MRLSYALSSLSFVALIFQSAFRPMRADDGEKPKDPQPPPSAAGEAPPPPPPPPPAAEEAPPPPPPVAAEEAPPPAAAAEEAPLPPSPAKKPAAEPPESGNPKPLIWKELFARRKGPDKLAPKKLLWHIAHKTHTISNCRGICAKSNLVVKSDQICWQSEALCQRGSPTARCIDNCCCAE